jgi:hypothetical protein
MSTEYCTVPHAMIPELVERLADGAHPDAVLISPIVKTLAAASGPTVWTLYASRSERGVGQPEFELTRIALGPCSEPYDDAVEIRNKLIVALRERFKEVHAADHEVNDARTLARLWPGERSQQILEATIKDYAERAPTEWPTVPAEEWLAHFAPGRVIVRAIYHDSWCVSQNGGKVADCNCEPIEKVHIRPELAA